MKVFLCWTIEARVGHVVHVYNTAQLVTMPIPKLWNQFRVSPTFSCMNSSGLRIYARLCQICGGCVENVYLRTIAVAKARSVDEDNLPMAKLKPFTGFYIRSAGIRTMADR